MSSSATDKAYWRSLERLFDSPIADQLQNEFPAGAADPPVGFDRRSWLKLMGASLALAGMASCRRPEEHIVPYVNAPEGVIPGIPKYYATTLQLGTSSYGVLVESHQGRPTKIEGNELAPSSKGSAASWMQAATLGLYDPDRSPQVQRYWREPEVQRAGASWQDFEAFWAELLPELDAAQGAGLAILSEEFSSPTLARIANDLLQRFPQAQWISYDPISDRNLFEGVRMATGTASRPVYQLQNAQVILALDCDLLLTESNSLSNARGFSEARRLTDERDTQNRLYVAESSFSVTGANADHRLRIQSRQAASLLAALAQRLEVEIGLSVTGQELAPEVEAKLDLLASDLRKSRSRALVAVGRRQPAALHAAAYVLNQALGAVENTLTLEPITAAGWDSVDRLEELVEKMRQGQIQTLVMLGGNPVYNVPANLDFATALQQVRHSIHLSQYADETSLQADWHLPRSHPLEAWGDSRGTGDTLCVAQPLIAPLFDTRSEIEVVGLLLGAEPLSGYQQVRATWLQLLGGDQAAFEKQWQQILHDGVFSSEEPAPPNTSLVGSWPVEPTSNEGLELVFEVASTVWDGRFANLAWLQELPDPVSKLTWGNAAFLSPATAARLQIEGGDQVRLQYRGLALEVPALILPGQADESVAVTLGYGRTSAGAVGSEVGFNAFALQHSDRPDFDSGLSVESTGRRHLFAQTQEHWEMEGRSIVRAATLEEYRADPDFATRADEYTVDPLWTEFEYAGDYQWGLSIDLTSCIGCSACVVACQSENNIPVVGPEQVRLGREMHWIRVDRYFLGEPDDPSVVFQPVPCMHCENAPCEQVCPVAATVHDKEGLNAMVYNRCIGTRYCSNNCPYKVRRFNFFNYTKDTPELVQMGMNPDVTVRSRGVMEKCTYCVQRISEAKIKAKEEGRLVLDGEIRTACQQTCPTQAITFGNINDVQSRVSQLKSQNRNYVVLGELYNKPRTSYLARVTNPTPGWTQVDPADEENDNA